MRRTFTYDGKRYSVQRPTERELKKAIEKKKEELKAGKKKESAITFKAYAYKWLRIYKSPYVSNSTDGMYQASINTLSKYIGAKQLKSVTSEDIQKIITAEFESGVSKSKLDKLILTVRQIYRQAVSDRIVVYNPTTTIKKPRIEDSTRRALTDDEYEKILERAKEHEYGGLILAILYL